MMPARPMLPMVETVGRDKLRAYLLGHIEIDGDGCWNWLRATNEHGYANVRIHGFPNVKGHRLMWVVEHGVEAASNLAACHTCDNRRCINPAHIFLATPQENARDRKMKGRAKWTFRCDPKFSRSTNETPYLARRPKRAKA